MNAQNLSQVLTATHKIANHVVPGTDFDTVVIDGTHAKVQVCDGFMTAYADSATAEMFIEPRNANDIELLVQDIAKAAAHVFAK